VASRVAGPTPKASSHIRLPPTKRTSCLPFTLGCLGLGVIKRRGMRVARTDFRIETPAPVRLGA
jgi:hypothetical protein